jgi:hypothetical protein
MPVSKGVKMTNRLRMLLSAPGLAAYIASDSNLCAQFISKPSRAADKADGTQVTRGSVRADKLIRSKKDFPTRPMLDNHHRISEALDIPHVKMQYAAATALSTVSWRRLYILN